MSLLFQYPPPMECGQKGDRFVPIRKLLLKREVLYVYSVDRFGCYRLYLRKPISLRNNGNYIGLFYKNYLPRYQMYTVIQKLPEFWVRTVEYWRETGVSMGY